MKVYNYSCQGESHKATDKECQDYSCTLSDADKGLYVAVVCDGHGGDTYFRSAVGAKAAADITLSTVSTFVADWDCTPIKGSSFSQFGTIDSQESPNAIDKVFRQLFASIYIQWLARIKEDANRAVTEWEERNVKLEHLQILQDPDRIVKVYGCTLMAYIQTPDYWFAFHIGDGKCVMIDHNMEFVQPIPWDERCFLNKTTSMCDKEPIGEFRYCFEADGHFPSAMFLGSDGLDDTFGDGEKLYNFYGNIIKEIHDNGLASVMSSIQEALPHLSKVGSKDDMSVAFVYDENCLEDVAKAIRDRLIVSLQSGKELLSKKVNEWKDKLDVICQQIKDHDDKRAELESRKRAIEREYERSKNDLEKTIKSLQELTASDLEKQKSEDTDSSKKDPDAAPRKNEHETCGSEKKQIEQDLHVEEKEMKKNRGKGLWSEVENFCRDLFGG